MTESSPTLELVVAAVEPGLVSAGFQHAGTGESAAYHWVRFRRHERSGDRRFTRMITVSHASAEGAFLADAYLYSRDTHTQTPVAHHLCRYGSPAEAETVAGELAAVVLGWVRA